jgi:hypothetical protein
MVTVSRQDAGFAPVGCKPCSGRNQYITGSLHSSRSCSTCPSGQVANKAHTWCGEWQAGRAGEDDDEDSTAVLHELQELGAPRLEHSIA